LVSLETIANNLSPKRPSTNSSTLENIWKPLFSANGSPRLAAKPCGAILNYLYALLESESRLALCILGLDPSLGMLHVDIQYRDSLACDVMEAARASVDAYVIDWLTREPLKRDWFFERADGHVRLTAPIVERLSQTAPMWARAIAPVAERVVKILSQYSGKPSRGNPRPSTPLTQQHRSEGRGNRFTLKLPRPPKQSRPCKLCGTEVVSNRYCPSCIVEAKRETMAQLAVIRHSKPQSAKSKARLSDVMSKHAVAISWWSPANLPEWLNEKVYLGEIQPRLSTVKVKSISTELGVSAQYASHIRSGKQRPHRRHWEKLATLAGVRSHAD